MVISIERVNIFKASRTVPDTMVSPEIPRICVGVSKKIILSRIKEKEYGWKITR